MDVQVLPKPLFSTTVYHMRMLRSSEWVETLGKQADVPPAGVSSSCRNPSLSRQPRCWTWPHEYDIPHLLKAMKAFLLPGLTRTAHEAVPHVRVLARLRHRSCSAHAVLRRKVCA